MRKEHEGVGRPTLHPFLMYLIIQEKRIIHPYDEYESLTNRKICIATSVENVVDVVMNTIEKQSLNFNEHFLNENGVDEQKNVVTKWVLNGNCGLGTMNYDEYNHYLKDKFGKNPIEKQQSYLLWKSIEPDKSQADFGMYISKLELNTFQYNHYLTDTGYFAPAF